MTETSAHPVGNPLDPRNLDQASRIALLIVLIALIASIFAYWPGLPGPMLFDDLPQLNGLIADSGKDVATVYSHYIVSNSGPLGRVVSMFTFIGSAITHGPDLWWWKYENLMVHMIGGLLVFWLSAILFRAAYQNDSSRHWIYAAVVSAVWLLHPLQLSTVMYTVQRMTELSTVFVLAGLTLYVRGRLVQETSPLRGWLQIGIAFLVCFPLAALSKENGLLFPLYVSLVELVLLRFQGRESVARKIKAMHLALATFYVLGMLLVLVNFSSLILDTYEIREFTIGERILTQFRVLVLYLLQLVMPMQSLMGFYHDDLAVSTHLFNPISTAVSMTVILGLFAAAFYAWKRLPLVAFGILFFFVSHVMESTVYALEMMFEHRNYLGSLGIMIAVVSLGRYAVSNRQALSAVAIIVLLLFSVLTWQRAITWSSAPTAYGYFYRTHPESPRLNNFFANAYANAGDFETARLALDKGGSTLGTRVHVLFYNCLEMGVVDDTELEAIVLPPDTVVDAHAASGLQALIDRAVDGTCTVSADALLSFADRLLAATAANGMDRRLVLMQRARLLFILGDLQGATGAIGEAYDIYPADAFPLYIGVQMLLHSGEAADALAALADAVAMERTQRVQRTEMAVELYQQIETLYRGRGQLENALESVQMAITVLPGQHEFLLRRAWLLLELGRFDEAVESVKQLRELPAEETTQLLPFADLLLRRVSQQQSIRENGNPT